MLCGIDEAGRGPIAGPLVVAGVKFDSFVEGLNDSKKLSQKRREALFEEIINNSKFHIVFTNSEIIDEIGLSLCIKNSILEIMQNIDCAEYLMDGNTSFGIRNLNHLIKADATIAEVSAASILAKVSRDRYMEQISKEYPKYNFDKHKGYGTKAHIEAIKENGYCKIHRTSFKTKELEEFFNTNKQESLF